MNGSTVAFGRVHVAAAVRLKPQNPKELSALPGKMGTGSSNFLFDYLQLLLTCFKEIRDQ